MRAAAALCLIFATFCVAFVVVAIISEHVRQRAETAIAEGRP